MESAGGFMDDVWRHFFCACCSLVQEDREVRHWERLVAMGEGLDAFDDEAFAPVRRGAAREEGVREEGERLLNETV